MTDSRLQELKRAWEASQSVEDEAAYLRERVRVGDLTQERLELAAYCGHEGAIHVAGPIEQHADLYEWTQDLKRWGGMPFARAMLAACRLALEIWKAQNPTDLAPMNALQAVEAHFECPCKRHEEEVVRLQDPRVTSKRGLREGYELVVVNKALASDVAGAAIRREVSAWVLGDSIVEVEPRSMEQTRPLKWRARRSRQNRE